MPTCEQKKNKAWCPHPLLISTRTSFTVTPLNLFARLLLASILVSHCAICYSRQLSRFIVGIAAPYPSGCFDRENVEFAIAFDQAQQILMERLLSVIWYHPQFSARFPPDSPSPAYTAVVTVAGPCAQTCDGCCPMSAA